MNLSVNRSSSPGQSGFTLIEALIALLVIMIGLLGVAGMQALAIHNTTQAHIRSLASLDAHSLASEIRANRAYWADTAVAPATVSIAASGVTPMPAPYTDCSTTNCTAAQSAAYSLTEWAKVLNVLPTGSTATITRAPVTGTAPSGYLVTLQWSEKNMKAKNQGVLASNSATLSTSVVVQP